MRGRKIVSLKEILQKGHVGGPGVCGQSSAFSFCYIHFRIKSWGFCASAFERVLKCSKVHPACTKSQMEISGSKLRHV